MARIFELQETKGSFQVKGLVNGVDKEKFYTSKPTKTGKDFRNVNFGCMYDDKKSVYVNLNGMPQQNVYFFKRDAASGKTDTKTVPWANRNKFNEEGYRMIGVGVGLEKTTDANGKAVNDKKTMTPYDACAYIKDYLMDDSSVFIRGNLEFSSFVDSEGNTRRSIKYVPGQISLCKEVKFEDYNDDNKPSHDFTQNIVFMGIDKESVDDKETGRFIVSTKIVTYNDIVDAEFIITDSKLAGVLRKNLKAYNAITVHGRIEVTNNIQAVEEEDVWGESNAMNSTNSPTKTELIITGATPSTLDKDTYTEKNVADAMKKIRASKNAEQNFVVESETDDSWGEVVSDDDESEPW